MKKSGCEHALHFYQQLKTLSKKIELYINASKHKNMSSICVTIPKKTIQNEIDFGSTSGNTLFCSGKQTDIVFAFVKINENILEPFTLSFVKHKNKITLNINLKLFS